MKRLVRLACALLALPLAGTRVSAQGKLWVVDHSGAAGTDFTAIQPAIDAAADGDTIVIRKGSTYAGFNVNGKSLVVKAEVGHSVTAAYAVVFNLSGAKRATLRGLKAGQIAVQSCAGPVLLEDMGVATIFFLCGFDMCPLVITDCDAVVLSRCRLFGQTGGPGVSIMGSTVHMYETDARGGQPGGSGAKGGTGVLVQNGSFLFASGGTIMGGCGADGGFPTCGSLAGAGGTGLSVATGATAYLLGVTLTGGPPGSSCFPPGPPPGLPSVGSFNLVAGYPRDYSIASLASGGSTALITYDGEAADLVFSVIALDPAPLFLLELAGTLVPAIPPILVAHGTADGSGVLITSAPLPSLPPGIEAFSVYAQGAAVSAVGAAVLAAPSQLTIR